ncbi:MAG TPA: hypothetical protein VE650_00355, partial [Acetobacteraceae bacterium]|nr:hypothetical protein [Acetobacteraceae bacterium]
MSVGRGQAGSGGSSRARLRRSGALWPSGLWARLALILVAAMAPLLALVFAAISADGGRVVASAEGEAVEAA